MGHLRDIHLLEIANKMMNKAPKHLGNVIYVCSLLVALVQK